MEASWVTAWKGILPKDIIETLQKDCAIVFNSRSVSENENYSTGSTYFIKANETPINSLETVAKALFEFHTKDMIYDVDRSGAEWWSQVIHPKDDIGTHWDRDYGLEEEDGIHVHPFYGTITYLSNLGSPTVVFSKVGSKSAEENILGNIEEMALCASVAGNHLRFNGNLLHAAPAETTQFDDEEDEGEDDEDDDDEEDEIDLDKLLRNLSKKRITFLVNIWINHIPSQSQRYQHNSELPVLSSDVSSAALQLTQTISGTDLVLTSSSANPASLKESLIINKDLIERSLLLQFNQHDALFDLHVPMPSVARLKEELQRKGLVTLIYPDPQQQILLVDSANHLSDEDIQDNDEDEEDSQILYEAESDDDDNDDAAEEEEEGERDEAFDEDESEDEEDDELAKEHLRKRARR